MHTWSWRNFFMLWALLIGMSLLSGVVAGRATGQTDPSFSSAKIAPEVQSALKADGSADLLIVLPTSADLSGARRLATKAERGQYVFDALRAHADASQAALRAWLDARNVTYQAFYISNKIYVPGGSAALAADLAARSDVAQIVPNTMRRLPEPVFAPDKPGRAPSAVESNLTFINAEAVWAMGITGEGVVLAGNDTGLQWDHPAIRAHYRGWDGVTADHNYSWWDATDTYRTAPGDGNGHGTHTTGTMVGDDGGDNQIGVAPGAQTIHCKNLFDDGYGYDADIIECFQWDLAPWDLSGNNPRPDLAPDAINNSWGGSGGSAVFQGEIDALQAAGILVEFSAGNNGSGCYSLGSPGDYPPVLTTGSVAHLGATFPGVISGFSSRGPSPFGPDPLPDIMAPGENIRSAVPGNNYASASGTSMSGPHVTGLIALLWSANPGLRGLIPETHQIILQTAVPLSGQTGSSCGGDYDVGPNNDWGHGTIDALAAVNMAVIYGDPGILTGHVTDAATNEPIPGVAVAANHASGLRWQRQTDADGLYSMLIFSGTYTVTADLYGYYTQTVPDVTITAEQTTTLDFALQAAPLYTVSGTVRDAVTGWPIYAEIRVTGYPGAPIWSNYLDGSYQIDLAAGRAYSLRVSAWVEGYQPAVLDLGVPEGDVTADIALQPDPLLCAAPGYQTDYVAFTDFEDDPGGFTVGGDNTSWQWGKPTNGPRSAHSGDNVWATNLSGNYGNGEAGFITMDPIDLSPYAGQMVIVSWWDWLETETCCDSMRLEVSPNGSDWYTYYWNTQYPNTGWTRHQVLVDSSFTTSTFQMRFGFNSDGSITYPGLYIDDVGLGVAPTQGVYYATDFETDAGFTPAGVNSSWEWGAPTRGPSYAHSGANVWATALGGPYNNFETSTLTSPTIDLSAAAGKMPYLTWWQWVQTEANYDFFAIEASADDGATWTTIFGPVSGVQNFDWNYYGQLLDPVFAVSTFRLRFTLTTDGSVAYPGIYIDDLQITEYLSGPPTLACEPLEGGLVYGRTVDLNTQHGINGATVSSGVMTTHSRPGPEPQLGDGFFALFAEVGDQSIVGRLDGYQPAVEMLTVAPDSVNEVTLALGAGFLVAEPEAIGATVPLGGATTAPLVLRNTGQAELTFALQERGGQYTPLVGPAPGRGVWLRPPGAPVTAVNNRGESAQAYPSAYRWQPDRPHTPWNILVYADDYVHSAPNTYLDQALQALAMPYTAFYEGDYGGFNAALAGQSWDLVLFGNDNWLPPLDTFNALEAYVQGGGRLIIHSWGVGGSSQLPLWSLLGVAFRDNDGDPPDPIYWWEESHPIFNDPQTVPPLLTPNGGIYGIYGQRVEPLGDGSALAGYTPTAETDMATLVIANDGRTVFKGFLDGQHSADADADNLPDAAELWINLIAGIETGFQYDVPWLSVDLDAGNLAVDGTQLVTVSMDASGPSTPQPGTYTAALRAKSSTPYPAVNVPVSLTVAAPADWGRFEGAINGLAPCDQPGAPLAGALVSLEGMVDLTSAEDGRVVYWMPAGVYTVTVTHADYASHTTTVAITAGEAMQMQAALRPLRPCGALDPAGALVFRPFQDEQLAEALNLVNSGAGAWSYRVLESPLALTRPADLPVASAPTTQATPRSGPASVRNRPPAEAAPTGAQPLSGWFGAAPLPEGTVRYGFAQCPENGEQFYIISGVSQSAGVTRAVWRYDASENAWTALPPIPTGQEAPAATCYQDRLYVLGGGGSNQFFIFDLNQEVWLTGAPLPRNVEGAAAAAWDGAIYLVGGDDNFMPGDGVSAVVNRYDIATNTWLTDGTPAPTAVSNMGYVQVGNLLYLAGGWGAGSPTANVDATQRYDLSADAWTLGPTFEGARADFALAATDRALYAMGGDTTGGSFFESSDLVDRLPTADWPNRAWASLGDRLPTAVGANNAGFCTQALFDRNRAEIWSVSGAASFGFVRDNLFREQAQERCPSVYGDVPWLTVSPTAGAVAGDATGVLSVAVDATGLQPGLYQATLVFAGNEARRMVAVEMEVQPLYRFYIPLLVNEWGSP